LDKEDKDWFLQLSRNNTFFFPNSTFDFWPNATATPPTDLALTSQQNLNIFAIVVNEVEQSTIQGKCSNEIVGRYGIFASPNSGFNFTVGLIFDCSELFYSVTPYKTTSLQNKWELDHGHYLLLSAESLIHTGAQSSIFTRNFIMKSEIIQKIFQHQGSLIFQKILKSCINNLQNYKNF